MQLSVVGTGWGPSFIPIFIFSHNNLNPSVVVSDEGLRIKVMRTTDVPWSSVESAEVKKGLGTTYCAIKAGKSRFVMHFRELEYLQELVEVLQERNIPMTVSAAVKSKLK